eukprot:1545452-Amphidinium_carterae.1
MAVHQNFTLGYFPQSSEAAENMQHRFYNAAPCPSGFKNRQRTTPRPVSNKLAESMFKKERRQVKKKKYVGTGAYTDGKPTVDKQGGAAKIVPAVPVVQRAAVA